MLFNLKLQDILTLRLSSKFSYPFFATKKDYRLSPFIWMASFLSNHGQIGCFENIDVGGVWGRQRVLSFCRFKESTNLVDVKHIEMGKVDLAVRLY